MEEPTTPEAHSTNSAFRESDIEFLRASAREWLEAVLEEDLDKHTSLEDLLADGTLLYRVSQHIKEDHKFPGHVETVSSISALSSPSYERKSSLKYQPYASVEAFLNVCKEVGLRDVDVFNPSDAVDKKDIRRVCVCLRRLSKKSRTLHILVPDFDNVKDTLITPASKMPREVVQKTKETLQQSASKSSSRSSENGQVSSETSSSIADLRKDDTESESPENEKLESATPDLKDTEESANLDHVKAETLSKVHHDLDVAAEHKAAPDSKYTVKVAEPGVETLPLAPHPDHHHHDHRRHGHHNRGHHHQDHHHQNHHHQDHHHQDHHVERNGAKSIPAASEAPSTAPKPTMSKIMLKPPGDVKPPVDEKAQAKAHEESQKGLFKAHLQGKAPYNKEGKKETRKKDDKDGGFPLLPVLGAAAAIAGGIVGLIMWKKKRGDQISERPIGGDGSGRVKGFIESGKKKLKKLRGDHSDSSSDSSSDSESDDEGHLKLPGFKFHSGGVYKVKEGDNLTKIAKKSGKKNWREIVDKNPSIDNPDLIYPGDQLKL